VLNPEAVRLGRGMFPSAVREIVSHHVYRLSLLKDLSRTSGSSDRLPQRSLARAD